MSNKKQIETESIPSQCGPFISIIHIPSLQVGDGMFTQGGFEGLQPNTQWKQSTQWPKLLWGF